MILLLTIYHLYAIIMYLLLVFTKFYVLIGVFKSCQNIFRLIYYFSARYVFYKGIIISINNLKTILTQSQVFTGYFYI